MPRTDIFLKVTIDHDQEEAPEKLASELCRRIEAVYGVRAAEMSHFTRHED